MSDPRLDDLREQQRNIYPIRQKSAHGIPAEPYSIARKCAACGASFLKLAPGKTGERGIWHEWNWYCSVECGP